VIVNERDSCNNTIISHKVEKHQTSSVRIIFDYNILFDWISRRRQREFPHRYAAIFAHDRLAKFVIVYYYYNIYYTSDTNKCVYSKHHVGISRPYAPAKFMFFFREFITHCRNV
jgi:hypothetical protein